MLCVESGAQRARNRRRGISDTIRVDSLGADTLAIDSVGAKKKEPLDAPVVYEANDSIVFMDGLVHLYGQSKVNYEKIELTSEVITMNMDSSTVFARGIIDSTGVESGLPVFKDSETPYESKEMRYNFKSKKGFINQIVTQQGEGYVVQTSISASRGSKHRASQRPQPIGCCSSDCPCGLSVVSPALLVSR